MNKYARLSAVTLVCAYFWYYAQSYNNWHFIDSVNLIFHEAGHSIFIFFGMFVKVAAGSGFQVALPLLISLYFFYYKQNISGALCLLWVGQNLLNVSRYAADAVVMQLDLLGGDGVIHDWNYLLDAFGLLHYTPLIAGTIYTLGLMLILFATILAIYYALPTETSNEKLTYEQ